MKIKIFLVILLSIVANQPFAQNKDGFMINGKLRGLKDGTLVYLVKNNDRGGLDTVSQFEARNQRFTFHGILHVEGEAYFIKFDTITNEHIVLWLENARIVLTGSVCDLSLISIKIDGSKTHRDYVDYNSTSRLLTDAANKLNRQFIALRDSSKNIEIITNYQIKIDSAKQAYFNYRKMWISQNPNSFLTPWLIIRAFREFKDTAWFFASYQQLTSRVKASKYGTELSNKVHAIKNTSVGAIVPELHFKLRDGTESSIVTIAESGKITLVDFWASWCKPCRDFFPDLKKLYKQYHDKGFNILAISIDHEKEAWNKALAKESLPWFNTLVDNRLIKNKFGISEIPACILVNNRGQIVASWSGENSLLENKIIESLGD